MPPHTFRLEWTARDYVTAANGATAFTTTGGELKVRAESEAAAVADFRQCVITSASNLNLRDINIRVQS